MRFLSIANVATCLAVIGQAVATMEVDIILRSGDEDLALSEPTSLNRALGVSRIMHMWKDPKANDCCSSDDDGRCRDTTKGTPYCGIGSMLLLGNLCRRMS